MWYNGTLQKHKYQMWNAGVGNRLLCVGGEKSAWYTLFAHAQFPQEIWVFGSLVPRPHLAFHRLQYGKAGEGLVSFLT